MTTHRFDLTGKVVVITGGTGLLGSAYCQGIAEHGAQVVMADLAAADPEGKAKAIQTADGREAFGINCDVSSEADVVTGWIVPRKDPESLACGIQNAWNEFNEFSFHWNLRKNNARQRVVNKYSIDKVANLYANVWGLGER
jgi:NAD(P)-dependent dehydrogenase (short-subunit alcohol dehydrogenase family)